MNQILPTSNDILYAVFIFVFFAILIWGLIDVWKSKAPQNTKVLWTLLVIVANPIGAIIWFIVGRKANK